METPVTEVSSASTEPAETASITSTGATELISSQKSPVSSFTDDDVPDWLRGAVEEHAETTKDESKKEETNSNDTALFEEKDDTSIPLTSRRSAMVEGTEEQVGERGL